MALETLRTAWIGLMSHRLRTALTDSNGRFVIYGLSTGSYTITVNADSWRGINREFKGKQKVKVTTGRTYSVGTLSLNKAAEKKEVD